MIPLLGYAESNDSSLDLVMVLGGLFILATISALAFVLILTARKRQHRHAELITVVTFFWAIISAGTLFYAGNAQMKWSKEYSLRLQTGYLDPQNTADAPHFPWALWAGLGVIYIAMLVWSLSKKRPISS